MKNRFKFWFVLVVLMAWVVPSQAFVSLGRFINELGSTLALTDSSGNVTDEFAYMPYGCATHTPHANSTDTPFQWLGGYGVYYDADTDLHLTLHRAYSSKMKRFISSDPLGIDGGVNVYAMANLNPLAFVDPYGLEGRTSQSFGDRLDSGLNKFSNWMYGNELARKKEQANYQAQYNDYMTNPDYATVRDYSQATRSVVDKLTTAFSVYGAYKTLAIPSAPNTGARSLQGSGSYPGVDRFRDITLQKGKIVYGGAPGQSAFYTTESGLARAAGSRSTLSQGLQVAPHPSLGYRPGVTAYEVIQDAPAAFGRALANPQHGVGKLPQMVVPNYGNVLRSLYSIPMGQ